MDEYKKKLLEELKNNKEVIKKVKEKYNQKYTKIEDKTKYKGEIGKKK